MGKLIEKLKKGKKTKTITSEEALKDLIDPFENYNEDINNNPIKLDSKLYKNYLVCDSYYDLPVKTFQGNLVYVKNEEKYYMFNGTMWEVL